jgi:hypothetical protein
MKLAQMERMAKRLEFRDALARHDHDNPTLADDFAFLTSLHGPWKPWMDRLSREGLTNVAGGLMGTVVNPIQENQATVTGSATEQALIPIALTPIEQNVASGKVYVLFASGTSTTAATPGTYTLVGRVGPAPTNASTGILGAVSGNFTPMASGTALPWTLFGWLTILDGGSTCDAVGHFFWTHASTIVGAGGPSLATSTGVIGGLTAATFDSTGSTVALWIGATHATSTTNTWVQQQHIWCSIN